MKKHRRRMNKLRFSCFLGLSLATVIGTVWGIQTFAENKSFVIENGDEIIYLESISEVIGEYSSEAEITYTYTMHHFYSESLHLSVDEGDDIETYQLIKYGGEVVVDEVYDSTADAAIDLSLLEKGEYIVFLNGKPISVSSDDFEGLEKVWYTLTRNGYANKVTVKSIDNFLVMTVEKVSELPDDVYDILIDAGHGGLDTGAVSANLIEAEEALKVSQYIANRLETYGLKVKLTREDEFDPAGAGNFDYDESAYYNDGRIEQVYRYQSKYLISNHLNALDGTFSGFEIYSSIFTSNLWAELISEALTQTENSAHDSLNNVYRVSEGTYKKSFICVQEPVFLERTGCETEELDYLYLIRESGGTVGQSSALAVYNEAYDSTPNYGAEAVLIEYAYMDNGSDEQLWMNHWQSLGEAVVKATLSHLGIEY